MVDDTNEEADFHLTGNPPKLNEGPDLIYFNLFRFQILPLDRTTVQTDPVEGINSIDDLLSKKNRLFGKVLELAHPFGKHRPTRLVFCAQDFFLFKVGLPRSLIVETEEFTSYSQPSYPSIFVAVWNDPDKQLIAIQDRGSAVQKPASFANGLAKQLNQFLKKQNLEVFISPLSRRKDFWKIVHAYERKIKWIEFDIITPNMSNISNVIPEDLVSFAKASNATRSSLRIENNVDSLKAEESDANLQGVVAYASNGGGSIRIKAHGVKATLSTTDTTKTFEIGKIDVDTQTQDLPRFITALKQTMLGTSEGSPDDGNI